MHELLHSHTVTCSESGQYKTGKGIQFVCHKTMAASVHLQTDVEVATPKALWEVF